MLRTAAVILAVACGLGGADALPSGWRRPTKAESAQEWRAGSPHRYLLAKGDFDGDSLPDEAALLVGTVKRDLALVVVLGRGGAPVVLERFDEVAWLDVMGVDLVMPGKYETACVGCCPECEPEEPPSLSLEHAAVELFKQGSATSFFIYDPATKGFRRVWIGD